MPILIASNGVQQRHSQISRTIAAGAVMAALLKLYAVCLEFTKDQIELDNHFAGCARLKFVAGRDHGQSIVYSFLHSIDLLVTVPLQRKVNPF